MTPLSPIFSFLRFYIMWFFVTFATWPFLRKIGRGAVLSWLMARCISPFAFALFLMHILKWTSLRWNSSLFWIVYVLLLIPSLFLLRKEPRLHRIERRFLFLFECSLLLFGIFLILLIGLYYGKDALGERPLDLGLVTSLWCTPRIPPQDFWYAKRILNAYYLGAWSVAVLGRGAFVLPWHAYFSGLAVTWLQVFIASLAAGRIFKVRGMKMLLFPFLLLMMGNGVFLYKWLQGVPPICEYTVLILSRIIPYTVNENPSVAFWVSELHGHVLALPILILLIPLFHLALATKKRRYLALSGFLSAILAMTDSWLVPPTAICLMVMIFFHGLRPAFFALKSFLYFLIPGILASLAFLTDFKGYPLRLLPVKNSSTQLLHLLALFGPMIALIVLSFMGKRKRCSFTRTGMALILASILLILFCEVLYFDHFIPPPGERHNTVFRFHYAAWIFLFLAVLGLWTSREKKERLHYTIWGIIIFFFIGGNLFPAFCRILAHEGIYYHKGREMIRGNPDEKRLLAKSAPWTLDARTALDAESLGMKKAAEWLFQNTAPGAVIAESSGVPYQGFSTVSAMSGRTAIMGETHVVQNRGISSSMTYARLKEVSFIYLDQQEAQDILKKYRVEFIILGPMEERAFPGSRAGSLIHKYQTVFQANQTRILKVE